MHLGLRCSYCYGQMYFDLILTASLSVGFVHRARAHSSIPGGERHHMSDQVQQINKHYHSLEEFKEKKVKLSEAHGHVTFHEKDSCNILSTAATA